MCLRDNKEPGYPNERFLYFFESHPARQEDRTEGVILFFMFIVQELTELLRMKNHASPSDIWKYQEENSIYENKVIDRLTTNYKKTKV